MIVQRVNRSRDQPPQKEQPILPLTPAQHAILAKAINTHNGRIDWFPEHIKGGARKKVLDGLFNRALITPDGEGWKVSAEGYDALGMKRPHIDARPISKFEASLDAVIADAEATQNASADTDAELQTAVAQAEASFAPTANTPRTREAITASRPK